MLASPKDTPAQRARHPHKPLPCVERPLRTRRMGSSPSHADQSILRAVFLGQANVRVSIFQIPASCLAAAAQPSLRVSDFGGCFQALLVVWALKKKSPEERCVVGGSGPGRVEPRHKGKSASSWKLRVERHTKNQHTVQGHIHTWEAARQVPPPKKLNQYDSDMQSEVFCFHPDLLLPAARSRTPLSHTLHTEVRTAGQPLGSF